MNLWYSLGYMKKYNKGFVPLLILIIIAVVAIGGGVYVYQQNKSSLVPTQQSVKTTDSSKNTNIPSIASATPSILHTSQELTISGSNLDPVNFSGEGNGWVSHSQVIVYMQNSAGQSGILWEEEGDQIVSTAKSIHLTLPSKICKYSVIGAGICGDNDFIQITPGTYSIKVYVAGRGTTNSLDMKVQGANSSVNVKGWLALTGSNWTLEEVIANFNPNTDNDAYSGRNFTLVFNDTSKCFSWVVLQNKPIYKAQISCPTTSKGFGEGGSGDRVRISGTLNSSTLTVNSLELVSALPVEQW